MRTTFLFVATLLLGPGAVEGQWTKRRGRKTNKIIDTDDEAVDPSTFGNFAALNEQATRMESMTKSSRLSKRSTGAGGADMEALMSQMAGGGLDAMMQQMAGGGMEELMKGLGGGDIGELMKGLGDLGGELLVALCHPRASLS